MKENELLKIIKIKSTIPISNYKYMALGSYYIWLKSQIQARYEW